MDWLDLALIALAIGAAAALALAVRRWGLPVRMSDHRANPRPNRTDPLHRRAAHYRASGALPRWDP